MKTREALRVTRRFQKRTGMHVTGVTILATPNEKVTKAQIAEEIANALKNFRPEAKPDTEPRL